MGESITILTTLPLPLTISITLTTCKTKCTCAAQPKGHVGRVSKLHARGLDSDEWNVIASKTTCWSCVLLHSDGRIDSDVWGWFDGGRGLDTVRGLECVSWGDTLECTWRDGGCGIGLGVREMVWFALSVGGYFLFLGKRGKGSSNKGNRKPHKCINLKSTYPSPEESSRPSK